MSFWDQLGRNLASAASPQQPRPQAPRPLGQTPGAPVPPIGIRRPATVVAPALGSCCSRRGR